MTENLPTIHALWVGSSLGEISRCCLTSFVMRGHKVQLHAYNPILDLPSGVEIVDANLVIPKDKIFKHKKTGSYALFSDLFRYELLKKVDGVYVDCDVYCLKPITLPDSGYLLGFEDNLSINGAVLAIPKDAILLNQLLASAYDPHFIPPWYSGEKRKKLKLKKIFGFGRHISDMPWGVIGPHAITYYCKKLELEQLVQPMDVFYPVHYQCINQLLDSDLVLEDVITSRTKAIHLYNEMLRGIKLDSLDPKTILFKLLVNKI